MKLDPVDARSRFRSARVATLATADAAGVPHLVPVTFAVEGDTVVFAIDDKPKSTLNLRRLRNITENPRVSLLVDHYEDDWRRLWWVRADGTAAVHDDGADRLPAIRALTARYPQYEDSPPRGPVVVIAVSAWSGWSAS
ncbi:TIGR03668 family PPOX class F420-dependent oxidoreductase [Prauserella alba]|uniref:TIGR03668 family PPOX class F420-dependent oxidoreductase n=1 Tax=Prauserella alba TaxID=176898 RepID=A0ABN1V5L7_9PSEU|nr:TIGR03668 family PPOX class F420-dependent oxidoreductase [Prauserella alba]MCP2180280.1 PPOX class probable F420-dependent enzyme, Rv0121 family [Prauserella alba]